MEYLKILYFLSRGGGASAIYSHCLFRDAYINMQVLKIKWDLVTRAALIATL